MSTTSAPYGEIEIGLHRVLPEAYEVELRVTDPGTEGEIAPAHGQARISLEDLRALEYRPAQYGETLAAQLFKDEGIREFYGKNKAAFDIRGILIRLRLLIGPSVPELACAARASLGTLVLGAQLADLLWPVFLLPDGSRCESFLESLA